MLLGYVQLRQRNLRVLHRRSRLRGGRGVLLGELRRREVRLRAGRRWLHEPYRLLLGELLRRRQVPVRPNRRHVHLRHHLLLGHVQRRDVRLRPRS